MLMAEHPPQSASPVSETILVPRKKRMTKGQPRMQTSIDVLAEVLAERCGDVYESDEYEPEDDGEDEEGGSDENERAAIRGDRDKEPEAKKRSNEPYKFTKCKLKNRHFLREGQGLAMIRSLGLEQFLLHTEVPKFNKSYCTEFISTYNHHKGSGVVNGRVIRITAQAVRKVTGLPLGQRGERAVVHDVRAEDLPIMDRLIPGLKRTSYGYDLRYLRYKDQTETFVAVASALSEKLVCRTFKLTYIKGAIILAMENSLRLKIFMQWADFMAETIKNALKLTQLRTRNVRFAFGEWLTGMIENALVDDVGSGLDNGAAESERELKEELLELVLPIPGEVTPEPTPAAPESLPLVVHHALQPQKFKKRARTMDMTEEVHRLQQELVDAEKREQWFVAMNLSMSREIQRLKQELDFVKGSSSSGTTTAKQDLEMQIVVKDSPTQTETEQQLLEKLIEHLQSRSIRHEAEVLRLKQAVDEQSNYIELIKQSRTTTAGAAACGKEPFDEASLVREQKRLRREWDKEKVKSAP